MIRFSINNEKFSSLTTVFIGDANSGRNPFSSTNKISFLELIGLVIEGSIRISLRSNLMSILVFIIIIIL
jgi:hypothetical protein